MQAAPARAPTSLFVALAGSVVAILALAAFLWTRDSTVTKWHVPYQVVQRGVSYPLYDKAHCYAKSDVAPVHRIGTASGLPLFAPPWAEPEDFYVEPKGYNCFMHYLSLSHVG